MKKIFTSILLLFIYCTTNATTYTVTSTSDASSTSGTNAGTLRWCILQANAGAGKDTINFALTGGGPYTFTVATNYAIITNPVYINGYSQTGSVQGQLGTGTRSMQIILNGPGDNTVYGLQITASNCEISGLVIQDFYKGIFINGGSNNWIWGCYIGTAADGLSSSSSTTCYDDGIAINSSGSNNIIGTNGDNNNDAKEGNCIGGNGKGVVSTGTAFLGECIAINEFSSTITGSATLAQNCTGTVIAGNYLGIAENGTSALYFNSTLGWQRGSGVQVNYSTANIIGTNADGISDALERNIISGNSDDGVVLVGSSSCKIKGNYIGTDKTGLLSVPNYANGGANIKTTQIAIKTTSTGNYIGTDGDNVRDDIEGNVIGSGTITAGSTNSYSDGIDITSSSTGNVVAGNYIGIGSNGTTALPILTTGITVNDYAIYLAAGSNRIGTNGDGVSDAYEANYIGNTGTGVYIEATSNNIVAGNYFGLGTNLTASEPLGYAGVYIWDGTSNRIGSTASKTLERNYFCNSSQMGIWVDGNGSANADLNNIRYNYVGIKPNNTAGSNSQMGIYLYNKANSDTIQYNTVAYNGTGSVTGAYPGIQIGEATHEVDNNVIKNNIVYKNLGVGVAVIRKESKANLISQNSIYNNGNGSNATGKLRLGIDLENDGLTANDNKDADDLANAGSNFPIITAAIKGGSSCLQSVTGTFNGLVNTQYYVEVFSSDVCNGDTSGVDNFSTSGYNYGEGRTYEGSSATFTTDGQGNGTWTASIAITNSTGQYLTATAIQVDGSQGGAYNTSEFSLCFDIKSDLGDAPDTYKTLLASCGPIHAGVNTNLVIGSSVTIEDDGQPSAAANLDSDDGITTMPTLTVKTTSYTIPVAVVNSSGTAATLHAWIDLNQNGSFEVGEYRSANVASTGAQTINLQWDLSSYTCGTTLVPGNTYLRMRLSTTALTDDGTTSSIDERCYGLANDGEVEDYKIYIHGYDYGDLSSTYPTATILCYEDTATAKVWAGSTKPSRECTQKYSADATGDGTEEDGLTTSIAGYNTTSNWVIRLNANQANKTVYYGLWLDWNGDGNFTSGTDGFYSGSAVVNGVTNANVSVYSPYGFSNSAFRVIVSDAALTSTMYNATITNGEIEDYTLLKILQSTGNILMGAKLSSGNLLKWKNTSGMAIRSYSLERSTDHLTWRSLSIMDAVSNDVSFQYSYTDAHPERENYYRLKFLMSDNSTQYSNTLPLFDNTVQLPVIIYPNPATNSVSIQTANGSFEKLKILDLTGREELVQNITSANTSVNISNLSTGTHLIKFITKGGEEVVKRFIKVKN